MKIICKGPRGRAQARAWVRVGSQRQFGGLGSAPGPFAYYVHIVCILLSYVFACHFHIIFTFINFVLIWADSAVGVNFWGGFSFRRGLDLVVAYL